MKETIKIALLRKIIKHYPTLTIHQVHCPKKYCVSGDRRLRELAEECDIYYEYQNKKYEFGEYQEKSYIQEVLEEELKKLKKQN